MRSGARRARRADGHGSRTTRERSSRTGSRRAAAIDRRSSSATSTSGEDRADRLQWAKFVAIAWVKDGSGFYYTRFPEPGTVPAGDEHYFNKVYFHRLGDPQERDALVFEKPAEREIVFGVEISDDDRWVVITAFQGASDKSEVYLLDRRGSSAVAEPPAPLFTGFAVRLRLRRGRVSGFAARDAPLLQNGRRRAARPDRRGRSRDGRVPRWRWSPNRRTSCRRALLIHGTLVASYLQNASDRIRLFDLDGAAGRHGRPAGDRLGLRHQRTAGRRRDVRRVQFVRLSAGELPLRLRGEGARAVRLGASRGVEPRGLRDDAGLVPVEGRHERVDVPGAPQGICRRTATGRCC